MQENKQTARNVQMMKSEINLRCLMIETYMTPEQINQMCQMLMDDMEDEPQEEVRRTMNIVLRRTEKLLLAEHFTLVDPKKTEEEKVEARRMMQSVIDEATLPEWALMVKQTAMDYNPQRVMAEMTLPYLLDQDLHYSQMMFNLYLKYSNLDQARQEVMEEIMTEFSRY